MNTALAPTTERSAALAMPPTGLSIFDSGTFEAMIRIASQLALTPLLPESLRYEGKGSDRKPLPLDQVTATCFLIVEQSARWAISPFAAAACASNVHGRLMWEGKLVAGVLDNLLGVNLDYTYSGTGENMTVTVIGTLPGESKPRTVSGSVKDWKTDQWRASAYEQRLAYRGAREWTRRHKPSVLLGVVTDDEELPEIRNVTPAKSREIPAEMQVDPFQGTAIEKLAVEEQPAPAETKATQAPAAQEDPLPANPATIPATGRQKKDPIQRDAKFHSLSQKDADGKTLYIVGTLITGKMVEFTTFSESLAESLRELDKGTPIRITVTQNADGKTFTLEDYAIIKEEGELI